MTSDTLNIPEKWSAAVCRNGGACETRVISVATQEPDQTEAARLPGGLLQEDGTYYIHTSDGRRCYLRFSADSHASCDSVHEGANGVYYMTLS